MKEWSGKFAKIKTKLNLPRRLEAVESRKRERERERYETKRVKKKRALLHRLRQNRSLVVCLFVQ